jgi:hypothetical protein
MEARRRASGKFRTFTANVVPCASPCDFIREPNETRRVPAPSHLAQRDVAKTFYFQVKQLMRRNEINERSYCTWPTCSKFRTRVAPCEPNNKTATRYCTRFGVIPQGENAPCARVRRLFTVGYGYPWRRLLDFCRGPFALSPASNGLVIFGYFGERRRHERRKK